MADEKFVPMETFLSLVKIQFTLIGELMVSIMTLRAALMQAQAVPVPAEELTRLDTFFRELPEVRAAREAIQDLDVDSTESVDQLLKNFRGPIQ